MDDATLIPTPAERADATAIRVATHYLIDAMTALRMAEDAFGRITDTDARETLQRATLDATRTVKRAIEWTEQV